MSEQYPRYIETDCLDFDPCGPIPQPQPLQAELTPRLQLFYEIRLITHTHEQERRGFSPIEAGTRAYKKLNAEVRLLDDETRQRLLAAIRMYE